ncbi:MAG: hypothetical protein HUJ76_08980 [Parasporobacterium sp.]|nr:hypothetical protein [Parasporobacterium sp.]
MEEKIIDIIEVTGYCEITDTEQTFDELEVEDDAFEDILDVVQEEFDIEISKADAADLRAGSVRDFINYIEANA